MSLAFQCKRRQRSIMFWRRVDASSSLHAFNPHLPRRHQNPLPPPRPSPQTGSPTQTVTHPPDRCETRPHRQHLAAVSDTGPLRRPQPDRQADPANRRFAFFRRPDHFRQHRRSRLVHPCRAINAVGSSRTASPVRCSATARSYCD